MAIPNKRVTSYLSDTYKKKLKEICNDREGKEAVILREIIKEYFDLKEKSNRKF